MMLFIDLESYCEYYCWQPNNGTIKWRDLLTDVLINNLMSNDWVNSISSIDTDLLLCYEYNLLPVSN